MALGLLLVLEGGLYALFPAQMKRAMLLVMEQPSEQLRSIGFAVATAGVAIIWAINSFGG